MQSDPEHPARSAALTAMECVVVQDIFLNETAKYAHVFLPGLVVPREGRHVHQRRAPHLARAQGDGAAGGLADWEVTVQLSNALGYPMHYTHPAEIMDEIAELTPTFRGVSYEKIDRLGSVQWPCNEAAPRAGTPTCTSTSSCAARADSSSRSTCRATRRSTRKYPLMLTTGRILSQYNVGAQTRRTRQQPVARRGPARDPSARCGGARHQERRLGRHRKPCRRDGAARSASRERMQPGVVYTTFHFPESGANVITTENSDWATNCPEYKVTAVQVMPVAQPSSWQREYSEFNTTS